MVKPDESFLQPAFLTSRKEVAAYLGKGIRTVQRWEGQFGLFVEELSGDRVRVSRSKLERWLKDNWVSTRQQMPPANSGQRTFRISKLIEKCQQLKAENRELIQKLREETERFADLCVENSEKIPVRQYIRKEPRQTDETHISRTRRSRVS